MAPVPILNGCQKGIALPAPRGADAAERALVQHSRSQPGSSRKPETAPGKARPCHSLFPKFLVETDINEARGSAWQVAEDDEHSKAEVPTFHRRARLPRVTGAWQGLRVIRALLKRVRAYEHRTVYII